MALLPQDPRRDATLRDEAVLFATIHIAYHRIHCLGAKALGIRSGDGAGEHFIDPFPISPSTESI